LKYLYKKESQEIPFEENWNVEKRKSLALIENTLTSLEIRPSMVLTEANFIERNCNKTFIPN
jgi:hypothetical protein